MQGSLASGAAQRCLGNTRRRRCHARASSPRGASRDLLTRYPSWIGADSIVRSRAAASAKSPGDVASISNRVGDGVLANAAQIIDSSNGRASVRVIIPAPPSNKAIQPPGLRCHVACLRTRRANPDPAPDRGR